MKRDEQDSQSHYALRKIGKDLLSVSVGIVFAGMLSDKEMNQVKAASVVDNNQVSQIKSNQEVVAFGKIIPVNQDMEPIANAPTPEYRRDPQDPNKAIATPAPEIKDYDLAKKDQADNVDLETKMVLPPANVQEDTKLVYVKQPIKQEPAKPNNNQLTNRYPTSVIVYPSKRPSTRPAFPNRSSSFSNQITRPNVNSNQVAATGQVHTNQTLNSRAAFNNSNSQVNTYQPPATNSEPSSNAGQDVAQMQTAAIEDNKASESKKRVLAKKSKKADKKKETKRTSPDKHPKSKAHPKTKKRSSKQLMQLPKVITNPETKLPPKPQKAVLIFIDKKDGRELLKLEAAGVAGQPIEFSKWNQTLTDLQEKGYQLKAIVDKNNDKHMDLRSQFLFGFYGENESEFVAQFSHKLIAVTAQNLPSNISPSLVKRPVSLVVRYRGAGNFTPKQNIQNAVFTRSLTMDKVTHHLIKDGKFTTPWHAAPLSYQEVISPKVNGYRPNIEVVPKMAVVLDDVIKTVEYEPIESAPQHTIEKQVAKKEKTIESPESDPSKKPIVFKPKAHVDKIEAEKPVVKKPALVEKDKVNPKKEKKMMSESKPVDSKLPSLVECHFVDQNGNSLRQEAKLNPNGVLPAIDGYYLVNKEINHSGMTAVYAKMANIVPVDQYGNLIPEPLDPTKAVAPVPFKADPLNPKQALANQKVPAISGWMPTRNTISPENNTIDIPVVYTRNKN